MTCPLMNYRAEGGEVECLKEKCAWWVSEIASYTLNGEVKETKKIGECAIALITKTV